MTSRSTRRCVLVLCVGKAQIDVVETPRFIMLPRRRACWLYMNITNERARGRHDHVHARGRGA